MPSAFDPAYQETSIEAKIVVSLERISQAFKTLLWEQGVKHSVSPVQTQILIFLNFHAQELCQVTYLAKELNITKATISDAVKVLEKKGLVRKNAQPNDLRSFILELTTGGEKLAGQLALFSAGILEPVSDLTKHQKGALLDSLLELIHKLNEAGIISIQRMCHSCRFHSTKNDGHYCHLLQKPLKKSGLRVNCPEHELSTSS